MQKKKNGSFPGMTITMFKALESVYGIRFKLIKHAMWQADQ